jgi:poly(3-hydroxybutyrate) depolymerase
MAVGLTGNAQTINVRGKVSTTTGKPVAGAVVLLAQQKLRDTTGADGTYAISQSTAAYVPLRVPETERISLTNGLLELSLTHSAAVKVEIVNAKGGLVFETSIDNASQGFYRLNIGKSCRATRLYIVRASIGGRLMTLRYLPVQGGKYSAASVGGDAAPVSGTLAKVAAINDTLSVSAAGYAVYASAIHSYDTVVNVTLDTSGTAGRSAGCGTTPKLLKSTPPPGTKMNYNYVTIQGAKRQYLLWYPDNYDNTHPYRLIICYHWYSGSASQVFDCKTEGISCYTTQIPFFNLLNIANNSTIFVAPDGIDAGWANTNNRDLEFTDSIVAQLRSNFCIDTTRIFACGFSYGGAMSYAIACNRAPVFRAVGVYAGGAMSGSSNTRIPIAYYAAHGISDNGIAGGRTARDHFIDVNGCTPQTAQEPAKGSGTHICTKYTGCSAGHPVVWCAFDGGHDPSPKDRGQSTTWNATETWSFFTQF